MPYKRPNSSHYQVRRRNLVGLGDTGVLSTRTTNRKLATRMERTLIDVAERALVEPAYRPVLEAVRERRIDLPTLQRFHAAGDLAGLQAALTDPTLTEAVEAFVEARGASRHLQYGAEILIGLVPKRTRLSELRDPRLIEQLCRRVERGEPAYLYGNGPNGDGLRPRKRNSVHRRFLRFVSKLLRYHWGSAERNAVFAEVQYAPTDDTREVLLTVTELQALLRACREMHKRSPSGHYDELAIGIRLAIQTSADRGVLFAGTTSDGERLGLRVRQVRIFVELDDDGATQTYSGEVYLKDSKTDSRPRTAPLTDALCRSLLPLTNGRPPDSQVFRLTYSQLDSRWKRVRKLAARDKQGKLVHPQLETLRFKDLRSQFSIYAERADVPLTVVQASMGHASDRQTRAYQRHKAVLSGEQAAAIERELGLVG